MSPSTCKAYIEKSAKNSQVRHHADRRKLTQLQVFTRRHFASPSHRSPVFRAKKKTAAPARTFLTSHAKTFLALFFSRAPRTRSHFSVRFFPRFLVSNCKLTARRQRFSDKWSRRKQRDSITRLINFHFAFYFSSDVDCIVVK